MFSRISKAIREYKEIKYLAYHDTLTGLLNRNWIQKHVHEKCKNFKYVYFIDINGLHEINKKGHTHGDIHIQNVVSDIQSRLNDNDFFVRYSGDEFIIFTNTKKNLHSNDYTFGFAEVSLSMNDAIKEADENMCKNKYRF